MSTNKNVHKSWNIHEYFLAKVFFLWLLVQWINPLALPGFIFRKAKQLNDEID